MEEIFNFNKQYKGKLHFNNCYTENQDISDEITLIQIGDLFCEGDRFIEKHEQICYEISLVISGYGTFCTNDQSYKVKQGDIYLNVPGEFHSGKADASEPFRYFYLGFDFNEKSLHNDLLCKIKQAFDRVVYPIARDTIGMEYPFVKFFSEIIENNECSKEMMKMFLKQIVIMAYRSFSGNSSTPYLPENERDEGNKIVYKVIHYLENNIEGIQNLPLIAEKLGYSYFYISHLFANKTGRSLQEYYNQIRFEKAKDFIQKDQMSFTQIAEKLNYGSIHSFSRAFKRMAGYSPSEFKRLQEQSPEKPET